MIDVTVTDNSTSSQSNSLDINIQQTHSCMWSPDSDWNLQYQVIKKINAICNSNSEEMIISSTISSSAITEFSHSNQLLSNPFLLIFFLIKSLPVKDKPLDIAFISTAVAGISITESYEWTNKKHMLMV